jgi:ABC-type uncharacterized transport system substrate-binding protein
MKQPGMNVTGFNDFSGLKIRPAVLAFNYLHLQ